VVSGVTGSGKELKIFGDRLKVALPCGTPAMTLYC
jgi:hypothetical protein